MLEEIHIKDFALIKELKLKLGARLNILTGETGAGKSIILGALNMVLGSKATTDLIRSNSEKSIVQAIFDISQQKRSENILKLLEEHGIESEDEHIILKREIKINGKGRSFINAQHVPTSVLKKIGSNLVEIHGQNEHQEILKIQSHLSILDRYAKLQDEVSELGRFYRQNIDLKQKLKSVTLDEKEKNRRIEVLSHEIQEIESAQLKDDRELEELQQKEKVLANAEAILKALNQASLHLSQSDDSIMSSLSITKGLLEDIAEFDQEIHNILDPLQDVYYALEDIHTRLREHRDKIHLEPEELQTVRERLDNILTLKNKYGSTVKEIKEYLEKAKMEYEGIQISGEEETRIRKELNMIESRMIELAQLLSQKRRNSSKELEQKVCKELNELGMQDTQLKISVRWDYGENGIYIHPDKRDKKYIIHSKGLDIIEFLTAAMKGNDLKPLRKIASGGEMSRFMLSIKKVIIDSDPVSTMVFDEVDAGIGGSIAESVGRKLQSLSENAQVIVITHLHQIAYLSGENTCHFKVEKDIEQGTTIRKLDFDQRIEELARMIGGQEIGESAISHAKVLLAK